MVPNHPRYQLRHTFTTMAIENGIDVKTLSATIGHVSAAITLDIYSRMIDTMQLRAAMNDQQDRHANARGKTNTHCKHKHARKCPV